MEEKIIIDGVNVAGCKYLNKKYITCDNENTHNIGCEHCEDCYYKQFKRLEQENEELKQTIKDLTQSLDDCNIQRTQLKARLTPLEDSYFNGLSSIEIAELAKKSIRITTYNRKLETALEEIQNIITENAELLEE